MSNTSSRRSILRYTKSVHKLCSENGKEEDSSDGEPSQPAAYHAKTFSHKTTSARIPLESIFANEPSTPTSPSAATISAGSSRSLTINTGPVSPKGDLGLGSPSLYSPLGSPNESPSGSPSSKKGASRRPLIRESASLHLPVRQIEQEGASTHTETIGKKDTITLYDWFKAMDAEAEKDKAYRGTLRGTSRSKTLRPTKGPARENSNFDYFVKQVEAAEAKKAGQNNNNNNNNKNNEPATLNMAKSRSMPRVESRWGIFDPPMKGTMKRVDGASLMPGHNKDENHELDKQIVHDDESLKVFMQAWNMLDTFEEHLAVQVELAQVEEEKQQMSKEKPIQDPSSLLVDVSFDAPSTPTKSSVPSDLVLLLSPEVKLPDLDPLIISEPTEAAAKATPATTEPSHTPATPATPATPVEPSKPVQPTPEPAKPNQSTPTVPIVTPPEPATDPHQSVSSLPKPVQEVITAIATTTAPEPSEKTPTTTPAPSDSKTTTPAVEPTPSPREATPSPREPSPRDGVPSTGPHYTNPIPADFVENLLQYCVSEGPNACVPRPYVAHIIADALAIFKSEPAIVDIPLLEKESKVVVVGDIHGQFPDLITILRDTDLPRNGGKMTLVFNGDFVDRGPAGVEVLLCLYSMKLLAPKNIFLHRGNHELESINRKYNFAEQVITKYDNELFLQIQDSFAQLPLGCVIAKKVLVIHGGLPEDPISLGQIRALPKLREDPTKATGGPEKIVQAILWSDPRDILLSFLLPLLLILYCC